MRWVLDTNVVVSALLWGGTPSQLLRADHAQSIALFTSLPLLTELTRVLGQHKFEQKIAASALSVDQLVDDYAVLAAVVRPIAVVGIAPDPDDDVVIGTALAANADLIVTGDHGLLAVIEHLGTRIVGVAEALQLIRQSR